MLWLLKHLLATRQSPDAANKVGEWCRAAGWDFKREDTFRWTLKTPHSFKLFDICFGPQPQFEVLLLCFPFFREVDFSQKTLWRLFSVALRNSYWAWDLHPNHGDTHSLMLRATADVDQLNFDSFKKLFHDMLAEREYCEIPDRVLPAETQK